MESSVVAEVPGPRPAAVPAAPDLAPARWPDALPLATLLAVTVGSLAGFAVFALHPGLLARAPGAMAFAARAFVVAPRAQVLVAFAALAVFLARHAGVRWLPAFAACYALSLGSELLGTTAGVPFGPYRYTDGLGAKWFAHVPVLIPLSWFYMVLPSYALAGRRYPSAGDATRRVLLASVILASWDLALDPAMSRVTSYWEWGAPGPYYGMPLLNLAGWYVTGVVLAAALAALRAERWLDALSRPWLGAFYGANLLLPLGMAAAAGLWGAVLASAAALAAWTALARPAGPRA